MQLFLYLPLSKPEPAVDTVCFTDFPKLGRGTLSLLSHCLHLLCQYPIYTDFMGLSEG